MNDPRAAAAPATLHAVPAAGDELDGRYAADAWQATDLGVAAARGAGAVSFTGIDPPWLRDAVKRWARQRLATGNAFNTIRAGAQALKRFSGFLGDCHPPVQLPSRPFRQRSAPTVSRFHPSPDGSWPGHSHRRAGLAAGPDAAAPRRSRPDRVGVDDLDELRAAIDAFTALLRMDPLRGDAPLAGGCWRSASGACH